MYTRKHKAEDCPEDGKPHGAFRSVLDIPPRRLRFRRRYPLAPLPSPSPTARQSFSLVIPLTGASSSYARQAGSVSPLSIQSSVESPNKELLFRIRGPLPWNDTELLSLIRDRYLVPPSTLPYNLSTDPLYNRVKHYGSWRFIHKQTKKLIHGFRGGFFVEAGALDGERVSNSLWLEQDLGWNGLLVEPDTENYARLVNKRRKAWITNTCLSPVTYPQEVVFVSLTRKKIAEDQFQRTLWEHRGASHILGANVNSSLYDTFYKRSEEEYYKTQCFPLGSMLSALGVTTIDLLSLDIQGVEKSVLRTLPWAQLTVRIIVIEIVNYEKIDHAFIKEMEGIGYILYAYQGEDYIFVRKGDPFLTHAYEENSTEET
ncbi:hypothetical protein C7M84_016553 [Penaeus vannamei]|uniref:Methyltransferase FkbM domain-containing protein n=1 Tax=Penaeus vannamei TaxID=6689 RepID=A0A3R7SL57_PENVA|nr:hypothetical protein C7M84_016553 [Penaeus vannamei]